MKIKITRSDGTVIEAEGTAEECAALIGQPTIKVTPASVPAFTTDSIRIGPPPQPMPSPYEYLQHPLGPNWWYTTTIGSAGDSSITVTQ